MHEQHTAPSRPRLPAREDYLLQQPGYATGHILPFHRRAFLKTALNAAVGFSLSCLRLDAIPEQTPANPPPSGFTNLKEFLAPFLAETGLPAIAAGVMKAGSLLAAGCVGVRKMGEPIAVAMSDKFHLGSCTKAMTATLAARVVEQQKISWSSTLSQVFPERAARMDPSYRKVTLEVILRHRAGFPRDSRHWEPRPAVSIMPRRLLFLDSVINYAAEFEPDTGFSYSNAGYVIAGAMLERVTGRLWDDLMRDQIFRPLGMGSAGIGVASRPNTNNQPCGHEFVGGKYEPSSTDAGPLQAPPGGVHCSIFDFLRFADFHASRGQRPPRLLDPSSFAKLHTARSQDAQGRAGGDGYALGWFVARRNWAKGLALTHKGSNGANLFVTWIAPETGLSIAVACNASNRHGDLLDPIAHSLIRNFAT